MAYLLLNKNGKYIRRTKDCPFSYDFNRMNLWEEVEITGKSVDDINIDYPKTTVKVDENGDKIWFCSEDDTWYKVIDWSGFIQRYDYETGDIINTIPEISANKTEEVQ